MIEYTNNGYDVLTNFFEGFLYIIAAYSFMKIFFQLKYLQKASKIFAVLLLYAILATAISTMNIVLSTVISFCFVCFMIKVLFHGNTGYAIVVTSLYTFIQQALQILILTILKAAFTHPLGLFSTAAFLLSSFIILAISQIIRKYSTLRTNREYQLKYGICLSLMPVLSIFIINSLFLFDPAVEGVNSFYIIFTIIVFFFLNLVVFKVFDFLIEDSETKKQKALFKQQIRFYSSYINENKAATMKARKNQHDLKNQLLHVKALLEHTSTEEALNTINKMIGNYTSLAPQIRCGNIIIDTILNTKIAFASRYNIDIETEIEVPESMDFADPDICILLGDAIDNSIDACKRMDEHKRIHIFIKYIHKNLIIRISNPYLGTLKKILSNYITIKDCIDSHGIGLHSIKSITEKYNGELKIDDANATFTITIMLILN